MKRLGIDVGGTFTDVVLVDDRIGGIWTTKVPTTRDPADGAIAPRELYGVVLTADGRAVDQAATEALRHRLRTQQGSSNPQRQVQPA